MTIFKWNCIYIRGGKINHPCWTVGDPYDCLFHFYFSVEGQNSNFVALFAIQNVVPTRIKCIPNSKCNVLTVPLYGLICSYIYAHITWFVFENDRNLSKQRTKYRVANCKRHMFTFVSARNPFSFLIQGLVARGQVRFSQISHPCTYIYYNETNCKMNYM